MKYLLDTDHISFLQRRSAPEHAILVGRMSQYPLTAFAFSVVSFHEQALGAHTYINRSRKTAELIRGYTLRVEIAPRFHQANAEAAASIFGVCESLLPLIVPVTNSSSAT